MRKPMLLLLLFILVIINIIQAQEEKLKVLFLCNYAKGIEWSSNSGDFIIGVPGNSTIIEELNIIAQKKQVGMQAMVVKKPSSAKGSEKCNTFFLPSGKTSNLVAFIAKVKEKQAFIITDSPGAIKNGLCINLVKPNDVLNYEKSGVNIEGQGLKVTANILALGIKTNYSFEII